MRFSPLQILNNEILCIDTWKMFQDFFTKKDLEPKAVQDLLNDDYNDLLAVLDMDVVMTEEEPKLIVTSTAQTMLFCDDKYTEVINDKKLEEYGNNVYARSSKNPIQEANEKTPKNQIMKLENTLAPRPFKKNNPKKRLDFGCNKPISLKLNAIYEYMFGSDFLHHSAEADCLAMIRCVINIADFFLDWSGNHAIPLICCKKT